VTTKQWSSTDKRFST